jgi:hypothetical protein
MRNTKGLIETIEAQQPPDAIPGQMTKGVGFAMYPETLEQMNQLKTITGIKSRSHLLRMIIKFADNHQSEFAEFLEEGSQLKTG